MIVRNGVGKVAGRESEALAKQALARRLSQTVCRTGAWTARVAGKSVRLVASPVTKTAAAWRKLPPTTRRAFLRTAAATMFFIAVTARTLPKLPEALHETMKRTGEQVGKLVNESAQNAFLKTLEEPPGKCLFLLTTGRASRLLPTVRSRCQILYLTDNKCEYDFPRWGDVPGILAELVAPCRQEERLVKAYDGAESLIGIASSLYQAASDEAQKEWESRLEQAQDLESAGKKLLEKRLEGATGSRYRRSREQFMSLIHTWCALLALRASGIPPEALPNREIAENMGDLPEKVGEKRAFKILDHAGVLLSSLRVNVNDELALRAFCLNASLKSGM